MFRCLNRSALRLQCSWEESLPLARSAGFEGSDVEIESDVSASRYADALARHGLRPGGSKLPFHFLDEIATTKEGLSQLERHARIASEIGCARFSTFVLPYSDTLPWKENSAFHTKRLGPIASVLAKHGCRLGLEFLGPKTLREGHKRAFVHTLQQMLDLCEAVGPNCGLLLDAWHWHTSLGTLEDILALSAEQVVYVHINDAPAGIPIEQHTDHHRRVHGETGVIDLPGFLDALRTIGYDGPVTPEPFVNEFKEQPPEDVLSRVGARFQDVWTRTPRPRLPERMKVVALGRKKAWLVEQPLPRPEGNQVVLRLRTTLLCGSNMKAFFADGEQINGGHEGAGEVVAVAHSTRLKPGDRVALAPITACGICDDCLKGDVIFCRNRPRFQGNFAQFTKVSDVMCTKLPEDVSDLHGAMLGCGLGPAFEAVRAVGARAFAPVIVSGLGPVGLGAVALAAFMGAEVIGLDPEEYRRKLACSVGASAVLDSTVPEVREQLLEITRGRGVVHGIECSGTESGERLLIELAAVRGKIAMVGENHGTIPISPSKDFIRKGLTLVGCWHTNLNDAHDLLDFIRRSPNTIDRLITHTFGFDEVQAAFETFAGRQCAKVALLPWK